MHVGAKLIKAVATKSDSIAGDGTTTSTLMTQVLINRGYKMIMAGASRRFVYRRVVGLLLLHARIHGKYPLPPPTATWWASYHPEKT
jgi:hypothetical protein